MFRDRSGWEKQPSAECISVGYPRVVVQKDTREMTQPFLCSFRNGTIRTTTRKSGHDPTSDHSCTTPTCSGTELGKRPRLGMVSGSIGHDLRHILGSIPWLSYELGGELRVIAQGPQSAGLGVLVRSEPCLWCVQGGQSVMQAVQMT